MGRSRIFALSLSTFALVIVACSSDDTGGATAQIRGFCASYVSSPAFSCCTADDRNNANYRLRYHFGTQAECTDVLSREAAQANGREGFDSAAAQSCLDHLNSRPCGTLPLADVNKAEQKAGCSRVLVGIQDEGQGCNTTSECKPGLVCPPIKETGLSFCSKPAGFNQDCVGEQASSVDHPACQEGLFCSFIGVNPAGCPSPPCLDFKCVPPFDEGEPCSATECAQGLVCKDGSCQQGQLANAGEGCKVPEHCAQGLYCDIASGTCAQRKADGEPCTEANNRLYECKGICVGGTCASFCGQ